MDKYSQPDLQREDFQNAIKELNTYIDVSLEDIMRIYETAQQHAQLRQLEKILVSELMTTDIITVSPETSLRDAAQILLNKRISGLPVVDEKSKLVGIVSEADFLSSLGVPCHHAAHNLWQTLEAMFRHPPRNGDLPVTVADIMVTQVVTISQDKTLHDVIDNMKNHAIKRLVVTNEEQQVLGIITRSNLVRVLLQQLL